MASWPAIVIFGLLTIAECVGKCVPVVDAVIDSAMTFVVPIFSILGSMASFGLFTVSSDDDSSNPPDSALFDDEQGVRRRLDDGGGTGGFLIFLQVMLCLFGIGLALIVHLFKLLLRLMGEGCCTCCITVMEYSWILFSVTLCIFIVPIAIGCAILLMVAGCFGFKNWWEKRQKKKRETDEKKAGRTAAGSTPSAQEQPAGTEGTEGSTNQDEEQGVNQNMNNKEATTQQISSGGDGLSEPLLP